MRRVIGLLLCLLTWPAFAQVSQTGAGLPTPSVAPPPSYTGPGDVASGALAWWGLRAYNASYATALGAAFDWTCTNSGTFTGTVHVTAAGGLNTSDTGTITSDCAATTVSVSQLYDQTGNSHHMVQGTLAKMPVLVLSSLNSLPTLQWTASTMEMDNTGAAFSGSLNSPLSISGVMQYGGSTSITIVDDVFNTFIHLVNATSITIEVGNTAPSTSVTVTSGHYHAVEALFTTSSVNLTVDASSSSASPSLSNPIFSNHAYLNAQFNLPGTFDLTEIGMWNSNISANFATLVTNQTTYWGPL